MIRLPKYLWLLLFVNCSSRYKNMSSLIVLPSFNILSIDSSICLRSENIPSGYSLIFMYFSPSCEHCQKEIKEIVENSQKFGTAKIYCISNDPLEEIKHFYSQFHLSSNKNIVVGQDYNYTFYNHFLPPSVPFMAIYDNTKKLIKIYKGEVNVNSLVYSIQQ